ncbi:hypothetical protein IEI94_11360 [Halomonas sp. ML-15]|uniref:Cap15 family cyclic dinucleotide receptor domain-containing protein n=1 Tax=Halomonas sp. ML-15 TaxID=2773305 RepID=UPI001747322F|nr:hypothetical protein [Halomonas sp. ML-15]
MNNLSLTQAELQRLLKVYFWLAAGLAVLLYFLHLPFDYPVLAMAWRSVTYSLASTTLLFGTFFRLAWRSPRIARWMRRPIVHGVWRGKLRSDFSRSDNNGPSLEIPIIFVVRQTYLTISIESFTKFQEGESKLEALIQNKRTEATRLCYVFELRRQYQGEKKLTSGAGELKLIDNAKRLRGHYWTNTPTNGDLELELISRDCEGVDCFEVAERLFTESQRG